MTFKQQVSAPREQPAFHAMVAAQVAKMATVVQMAMMVGKTAAQVARTTPPAQGIPMRRSTQKRSSSGVAVVLLLLAGCQELDLPPLQYETERARIGTTIDDPLCAGDLLWFDRRIASIEELSGVTRTRPVEVYIYDGEDSLPCSSSPIGCYNDEEDIVIGIWPSIDHELVHAVTRPVAFPSLFWSEGTAEALTENGTHVDRNITLDPDLIDADARPSYAVAGHFVRFLYETLGHEDAQKLFKGASPEDTTGLSLQQLTELYEADAPFSYAPRDPCPDPEVPALDGRTWAETFEFSCETEDASQFEGVGAGIVRTIDLDQPGEYDVLVEGGDGVRIVGCQMEDTDADTPWFAHGDVMNQAELSQTAFGTFFEADRTHTLTLTEGRYRLAFTSGRNDGTEMRLQVARR